MTHTVLTRYQKTSYLTVSSFKGQRDLQLYMFKPGSFEMMLIFQLEERISAYDHCKGEITPYDEQHSVLVWISPLT